MSFTKMSPERVAALGIEGLKTTEPMECEQVAKLIAFDELDRIFLAYLNLQAEGTGSTTTERYWGY